jgi:hypothetical protein
MKEKRSIHPYSEITKCRLCGNENLLPVLDMGIQTLSGVFPKRKDAELTAGPLQVVKCREDIDANACGLLQLRQTYDLEEMYGNTYGYRSGLNRSMVDHLVDITRKAMKRVRLDQGDFIVDIGSNDATLLKSYPGSEFRLIGMDPLVTKFRSYYPEHIETIDQFFSARRFKERFGAARAKIITSIAVFYDLESPLDFARDVAAILHNEGIWILEQSYMPLMIENNAYDTVCHEHLEYYCVKQIRWILERAGMKIVDIELNDTNGGSFQVTAAKRESSFAECAELIGDLTAREAKYATMLPFQEFGDRIIKHREEILGLLHRLRASGKRVFGYGASTKGNVLLQYCKIGPEMLECIAEVNEEKFGSYTPATHIPIISEKEAKDLDPDYFLVLPWHFKSTILQREQESRSRGIQFIFPLPTLTVV